MPKHALGFILTATLFFSMLFSVCSFGSWVQASTVINSVIITSDTTWTKQGSPYSLNGPVAVDANVTLTIEAGTVINLNRTYIQVRGTLNARGTETDRIIFNNGFVAFTAQSAGWNEQTSTGSIIQNANFTKDWPYYEDSSFQYKAQIVAEGSSPKLTGVYGAYRVEISGGNSQVTFCRFGHLKAVGSQAISDNTLDSAEVYGSQTFLRNRVDVLYLEETPSVLGNEIRQLSSRGTPLIKENIIGEKDSLSYSDRAITVKDGRPNIFSNIIYDGMWAECESANIWNNTISYMPRWSNDEVAVYLKCSREALIENNVVTGLVSPQRGLDFPRNGVDTVGPFSTAYGLQVNAESTISHNLISGCSKASILVESGTATIEDNILNEGGLILNSVDVEIHRNNLQINANGVYLWSQSEGPVNATDNWWGTTDEAEIQQKIFDKAEDYNLPKVNYTPFLASPNTQAGPDPASLEPAFASTPTPSPAATAPAQNGGFSFSLDWEQVAIVVLAVVVAVLLAVVAVFMRRK